jgi:hypothetical protein
MITQFSRGNLGGSLERDPNGYHRRGSGATVGDSHRGPLNNRENPLSFAKNKTQTN